MKYFRNLELAEIYHVSEKSVRNWIEATNRGKLALELYHHEGRQFIANTSKNQAMISQLVEKGKKYKNSRAIKTITPSKRFYDVYGTKQILDIIANIDIHREIPRQYNYVDGGAIYWDTYAQKLLAEETPNMLNSTIKLLKLAEEYVTTVANAGKKVNIIDLGIGDCLPVKGFLATLQAKKLIKNYIGIDISREMLAIGERNIRTWFESQIPFEGHQRDINYDRFEDIIAETFLHDKDDTINLVLVLGGTLLNLRSPAQALNVIANSMSRHDLLIYPTKLDTETSRRFFDFDIGSRSAALAPNHRFILDLLCIDESYYEVEQMYDPQKRARFIRIKFKIDLLLKFSYGPLQKQLELKKGETILMWRYWHLSALDMINQLDGCGFDLQQAIRSEDQEYLLTISKLKTGV